MQTWIFRSLIDNALDRQNSGRNLDRGATYLACIVHTLLTRKHSNIILKYPENSAIEKKTSEIN